MYLEGYLGVIFMWRILWSVVGKSLGKENFLIGFRLYYDRRFRIGFECVLGDLFGVYILKGKIGIILCFNYWYSCDILYLSVFLVVWFCSGVRFIICLR